MNLARAVLDVLQIAVADQVKVEKVCQRLVADGAGGGYASEHGHGCCHLFAYLVGGDVEAVKRPFSLRPSSWLIVWKAPAEASWLYSLASSPNTFSASSRSASMSSVSPAACAEGTHLVFVEPAVVLHHGLPVLEQAVRLRPCTSRR